MDAKSTRRPGTHLRDNKWSSRLAKQSANEHRMLYLVDVTERRRNPTPNRVERLHTRVYGEAMGAFSI